MAFSDATKDRIKERSNYACCVCREVKPGDVHHIQPQGEVGSDDADNGAFLCPTCHRVYGSNPDLRKWLRGVRDNWYGICGDPSAGSLDAIARFREEVEGLAKKEDVARVGEQMFAEMKALYQATSAEQARRIDALASQVACQMGVETQNSLEEALEHKPLELSSVASTASSIVAHSDAVFGALGLSFGDPKLAVSCPGCGKVTTAFSSPVTCPNCGKRFEFLDIGG